MRKIADKHNAWIVADMAHISGLVSAGAIPGPFEYSDVVTTTTHKSLRGPRGAMIFYRKGQRGTTKKGEPIMYDIEDKVNFAVFPGLQGGPHNHTITALATALKQANTPDYKAYQHQVLANATALSDSLQKLGYSIVSGGTSNHLILVDLKTSRKIDGARVERVMELVNMAVNKNTIPGDTSALMPSGIRMGTPALTSRGFTQEDFEKVAKFFDRAVGVAAEVKGQTNKLKDFRATLADGGTQFSSLVELRKDVVEFARSFPTVGFEEESMKFPEEDERLVA